MGSLLLDLSTEYVHMETSPVPAIIMFMVFSHVSSMSHLSSHLRSVVIIPCFSLIQRDKKHSI